MSYNKIEYRKLAKNIAFQVLILIIILTSIYLIRATDFNKTIPKSDSYYNYRLSTTKITGLIQTDNKIIQERTYINEPFFVITNTINSLTSTNLTTLIPFIIAILTVIIILTIVAKITTDKVMLIASGIILTTSPELIYLATTFNPAIFTIFLLSLLVLTLIKFEDSEKKLIWGSLTIVLTILISITNVINFLFIFFLMIAFFFIVNKRTKHKTIYYILFFIGIGTFFLTNYSIIINQNIQTLLNNYKYMPDSMLTELGANHGIRLIDIILTFIGIGIVWSKKKKHYISSITLLIIAILSFKLNETTLILFPIYAIISGYAISFLLKREWQLKPLKYLGAILVIIITFSSTIQYIGNISFSEPTHEQYKIFTELRTQGNNKEVAFSSLENGYFIELLANKKVVLDENLNNIKDIDIKLDEYNKFLNTRNIEIVKRLTNKWNLTYIIIDSNMKNKIWKNKEEGLLFVIKNSDLFHIIAKTENYEIYELKK